MTCENSLILIMDGNFVRVGDKVLSPHMAYEQFAARFTDSFDDVQIVARSFPGTQAIGDSVTGERTSFIDLGANRGARGLIKSLPRLLYRLHGVVSNRGILLIRFPGNVASLAMLMCLALRRPFSVEIVADAADYFSDAATRHPLRRVAGAIHQWTTSTAARRATTARYVTKAYLQSRYPGRTAERMFGFSDAYLPDAMFMRSATREYRPGGKLKIINTGMMHNHSKGHLVLLRACAALRRKGVDLHLTLVGNGVLQAEFKREVARLNLTDHITFEGVVAAAKVRELLARSELFVLASFQEGLPRAMLEAMAVGTPVIATNVGGVREALPEESLVAAGDVDGLARRIAAFAQEKGLIETHAAAQRERALAYSFSLLQRQYQSYCKALVDNHAYA
jgi:glycosyltransferase involved in cell wall biosynthesis